MVFFTCNHCGESLKKQAVEKHYTWKKCQNASVFVTCVDCLKDFRDQEYVAHTKCISEAEKYHGKDFQAKPPQNKGQKKQEAWTDIIQSVLAREDLTTRIRGVLNTLTKHENVPRKKAKFLNFMKNVSRQTSEYDCNRIFDLIEEAFTESKGKVTNGTDGQENGKEEVQEVEKGRKRKKNDVENGANGDSKEVADLDAEAPAEPKKKKKKAKKVEEAVPEPSTETVQVQEEVEKPKKKRKKQQNGEKAEKEELPEEEISPEPEKKKKKKEVPESSPKKSKTRKEVVQEIKNSSPESDGFPWKDTIMEILAKGDNKVSLEKVKKRLLKKYQKKHPENTQIVNAFDLYVQRKIRKMKDVSVEGDFVIMQIKC